MYRFAPSPTGDMHIGNLMAALFNYICAKKEREKFILRIEDTDKQRNIDGKDEEIKEILTKFGIKYDELYIQSKNLKFHREFAHKLLMQRDAFCCFCTQEELDIKKELAKKQNRAYRYDGTCENLSDEEVLNCEKPFVIRMKKPKNSITYVDEIKGKLTFSPDQIDSFVIMRVDKTPTYNFACAIDDMLMDITYVIRGEDHTSNTPKQEYIRSSLGYNKKIKYAHLPIILNEEGKKMSKRDDSSSVKWLLEQGFLPEAIINYLILLGNKTPKEVFTLDEAIEWFDIKNLSKNPAKFDIKKLAQLNREHIKLATAKRLSELFDLDEKHSNLIKFFTQESSLIPQIREKILQIYSKKDIITEYKQSVDILRGIILNMKIPDSFTQFSQELCKLSSLKDKALFAPLRLMITGREKGPELGELYKYIKDDIKEIVRW